MSNKMIKPQDLYEQAKREAYEKQVSTASILDPLKIKHGYKDEKGMTLKNFCIMLDWGEDLNEIPTKDLL